MEAVLEQDVKEKLGASLRIAHLVKNSSARFDRFVEDKN